MIIKKPSKKSGEKEQKLNLEDSKLLENSFNLIKNLNSQVEKIDKQKEKLTKDVEILSKKIDLTKKISPPTFQNQFLQKIKQEIISEFMPLIKKLNLKSLDLDLNQEINQIIEIETNKLKSELTYKQSKDKKELSKRITQIEIKLIDFLRENKKLKNEFDVKTRQEFFDQLIIIEEKTNQNIVQFKQKTINLEKTFEEKNNILEVKIKKYFSNTRELQNKLDKLSKNLNNDSKLDISLIESKIKEFQEDINFVKQSFSKFENDKNQKKNIIDTYSKKFQEFEIILNKIKKDKEEELKFLTNKFDGIILKANEIEKSSLQKIDNEIINIKDFNKEEIENFKSKNLIKNKEINLNFIEFIKNNIEESKKILNDFLKENQKNISSQILNLNEFKSQLEENQNSKFLDISIKIEQKLINTENQINDKIKDDIIELNNFKNQIENSNKEIENNLKEKIERKNSELILKQNQKLDSVINKIDLKIETQEIDIIKNIKKLEKKEIGINKQYNILLDKFENHFKKNLSQIILFEKENKEELKNVIKEQILTFQNNENSFRNLFKEKINNLEKLTKKNLEDTQKKLQKKIINNIDGTQKTIKSELKLITEEVYSKADELEKKMKEFETKKSTFYIESNTELKKIDNYLEETIKKNEQNYNIKFLDYDSSFNTFKRVISEEVEDLIKEITTLTQNKITTFNTLTTRLNFEKSKIEKKICELKDIYKINEKQIEDSKKEIENLKLQIELSTPATFTINNHIEYMREYENQLIKIIKQFEDRNFSYEAIFQILIKKGHPMIYVSMVLDKKRLLEI